MSSDWLKVRKDGLIVDWSGGDKKGKVEMNILQDEF